MIVDCPNCAAQFRVEDGVIPATGRRVRCTACAHVWLYVAPTPDVPEAPEPVDFKAVLQQTSASPVAAPTKKPFVVKAKTTFWHADRPGLLGYAASIIVVCAVVTLLHGYLVSLLPQLRVIATLWG